MMPIYQKLQIESIICVTLPLKEPG